MSTLDHVTIDYSEGVALVSLRRGKVNAINSAVVAQLGAALDHLLPNKEIGALVLTGSGKFFSFGLDVPELFPLDQEAFTAFLTEFTGLYMKIYVYPKPVLAAINGHAIAGGCMLATACDARWIAAGQAKIGLNEITFGSSVFAGSVEILTALIGHRNAEVMLRSGTMYDGEAALALGLVDRVVPAENLLPEALQEARRLARLDPPAYAALKGLVRTPVKEAMARREAQSIREFVEIWYSPGTREQLKRIEIRG